MSVVFGVGQCALGYVLWRLYLKQQIKPIMLLLTAALSWTTRAAFPSLNRTRRAAVHSVA
jgi:hypothetical protein